MKVGIWVWLGACPRYYFDALSGILHPALLVLGWNVIRHGSYGARCVGRLYPSGIKRLEEYTQLEIWFLGCDWPTTAIVIETVENDRITQGF